MQIGVGRIVLDFYNNPDLKLKRRKTEELCKELRKKFNLSMLEVADFEDPERCVIGFAAVIPENWPIHEKGISAEGLIRKICKTIDETSFARISIEDCDVLSHGDF